MVQIPSLNTAANAILGQVLQASESRNLTRNPQKEILKAAAGGQPAPDAVEKVTPHSKLSEQLFSLDKQTVAKLKMQLFERVGEELGVDINTYAKFDDFVRDVEAAFLKLQREGGALAIKAIERAAGLDELGLTLRDVIDSMKDPDANDKVSKALMSKHGLEDPNDDEYRKPDLSNWL
jgi:hypothetical protein